MDAESTERLIDLRRDLHMHPEPAWREFYTTARLVEEIERIGVDELYLGTDAVSVEDRLAVPEAEELDEWYDRARSEGVPESSLATFEGGFTGAVAVVHRGEGPVVAVRVDIDGLECVESTDPSHAPVEGEFRSKHPGMMHACGHDAHAAIGIGVLEALDRSEFEGTVKVIFQPGEEMGAGGKPIAKSGHLDDVEYLLPVHVGLYREVGEVVGGMSGFLALSKFTATFEGTNAHAGGRPNEGDNAIQALATAIQNLYAIPRHEDGPTRVNAGVIRGGTAPNVIADEATLEGEIRGQSDDLWAYMDEKVATVLQSAADMHGCTVAFEMEEPIPSADSDDALATRVAETAAAVGGVHSVDEHGKLASSEDASFLMKEVQGNGGLAAYVGVGGSNPTSHHSPTFDVDEECIAIGVDVLVGTIESLSEAPIERAGEKR